MAWGAKAGAGDWLPRLRQNDPNLRSILVLSARKMQSSDWQELCGALEENTMLEELKASGHCLDPEATAAFSKMLAKNVGIKRLALGNSEFGDQGVEAVANGLSQNLNVLEFELDLKGIGPAGAEFVGSILKKNRSIQVLKMARNPLKDEGVSSIAEGLSANARVLSELDLTDTQVSDQGLIALASALKTEGCGLKVLSLNRNPDIGQAGASALWRAIAEADCCLAKLELNEVKSSVSGSACQDLVSMLASEDCKLQELLIEGSDIDPLSVPKVAAAIGASQSLRNLRIANSRVEDNFVSALVEGLASNPLRDNSYEGLVELDLTSALVTARGMEELLTCGSLKLSRLVLFDNKLSDGAESLATTLRLAAEDGTVVGGVLKDVDLGSNGMSEHGVLALLKVLRDCPTLLPELTTLGLGANEGVKEVEDGGELANVIQSLKERPVRLEVVIRAGTEQ